MGDALSTIARGGATVESRPKDRLYGADSIREVRGRAALQPGQQSVEEQLGLERLRRAFASGEPLNPEAPRGYYLNIRI